MPIHAVSDVDFSPKFGCIFVVEVVTDGDAVEDDCIFHG